MGIITESDLWIYAGRVVDLLNRERIISPAVLKTYRGSFFPVPEDKGHQVIIDAKNGSRECEISYVTPQYNRDHPVLTSKFNLRYGISDLVVRTNRILTEFSAIERDVYGNTIQERVFAANNDINKLIGEFEKVLG